MATALPDIVGRMCAVRLNRFPSSPTLVSDHRLASSVTFGLPRAVPTEPGGGDVMRKELHADDTLPSDKLSLSGGDGRPLAALSLAMAMRLTLGRSRGN